MYINLSLHHTFLILGIYNYTWILYWNHYGHLWNKHGWNLISWLAHCIIHPLRRHCIHPWGLSDCPWPTRWEAFKAGWNQRTIARGWESPGSPKRCNPNRKGVFQLPFCWEALDDYDGFRECKWSLWIFTYWMRPKGSNSQHGTTEGCDPENMNAEGLHQNLLCVHVCVWFPIVWNDQTEWSRITTFFSTSVSWMHGMITKKIGIHNIYIYRHWFYTSKFTSISQEIIPAKLLPGLFSAPVKAQELWHRLSLCVNGQLQRPDRMIISAACLALMGKWR